MPDLGLGKLYLILYDALSLLIFHGGNLVYSKLGSRFYTFPHWKFSLDLFL